MQGSGGSQVGSMIAGAMEANTDAVGVLEGVNWKDKRREVETVMFKV